MSLETTGGSIPLPRPIVLNGGIHITLKAYICCANCTANDEFRGDPEAITLEQFGFLAVRHFQRKGWKTGVLRTLCPDCWLGDHDQ